MAVRLCEAAEPTNTPTNATRATRTQPGFAQSHNHLRPAFPATWRLPSGTDHAAQPTRRLQPQLARAPAGHHSPTGSRGFLPLNGHPPPLLHSSPRPRVPTASAEPTDALRSPSTAGQPCISTREAPENPLFRGLKIRRLHPPAAQQPRAHLPASRQRPHAQGCWGLCRTTHSHRAARNAAETENRFGRAGASGRPVGVVGTTQGRRT